MRNELSIIISMFEFTKNRTVKLQRPENTVGLQQLHHKNTETYLYLEAMQEIIIDHERKNSRQKNSFIFIFFLNCKLMRNEYFYTIYIQLFTPSLLWKENLFTTYLPIFLISILLLFDPKLFS